MVRSSIDCKVEIDGDRWPRAIAMEKLILSLVVVYSAGLVSCQYEQAPAGYQRTPPPSNILVHKQALGQDGSFNYAFAADNGLRQGEIISPDGSRKGSYSYVDPNGKTVTLSYTAGKDGFRVLSGDHVPKSSEPQQQAPAPSPQYYQQQPQNQHYSQPQQQASPNYPLFRPNPIPFDAYRNAPSAPAYRANPAPYQEPYRQPALPQFGGSAQYEAAYRQPQQAAHQRPAAQYSQGGGGQQGNSGQQYGGDYQEDPRKPHSFGSGYAFEFAG